MMSRPAMIELAKRIANELPGPPSVIELAKAVIALEDEPNWLTEIRVILAVVGKHYEPTAAVIDEMGWCCYCKKKQNEQNECGCL